MYKRGKKRVVYVRRELFFLGLQKGLIAQGFCKKTSNLNSMALTLKDGVVAFCGSAILFRCTLRYI